MWMCAILAAAGIGAGLLPAQFGDTLPPAIDHPAIDYFHSPDRDPVADLNRRLEAGTAHLKFEGRAGYLRSVLAALDIPIESQVAVFSKTSMQFALIEPRNPRTIFFNDQVAVAWMWGGFIEILSQDPQSGARFYTLPQDPREQPRFARNDSCLRCHQSEATLGIAGPIVRSVYPGPEGEPMLIYGGTFTDHRTPFAERWGGFYVTGAPRGLRHLGNGVVTDRDHPEALLATDPLDTLDAKFPVSKYLSPYSDAAALLVFDHQMHMTNLITRFGWEVQAAAMDHSADLPRLLRDGSRELVDYLLFVDEVPLPGKVGGHSGFATKFAEAGPRDSKGRSLRDLDLETRLLRYPCSYMIYTPSFDALPQAAKEAIYHRLATVLSGGDPDPRYARLTAADRQAITEILRDTKPEAVAQAPGLPPAQ